MSSKSFISSAVLHGIALSLIAADFSFARIETHEPPPAILMVDLTKVQVSDKTNLPSKQVQKSKPKPKATAPEKPKQTEKLKSTQVRTPQPTPPKPKPQEPVKDAAVLTDLKKSEKKSQNKTEKKPLPKPTPEKNKAKQNAAYDMKSLLASVEKVRRTAPVTPDQTLTDTQPQNTGIDGGTGGSFAQILTVSERDLIASGLKKCWYVDGGAKGAVGALIEIRAKVNKAGRVTEVKIINDNKSDASFTALAESARRAVLVCDEKGEESPFRILAEKYGSHYSDWKELYLRFNPIDGAVF